MSSGWFSESYVVNNGIATLLFLATLLFSRVFLTKTIRTIDRPWSAEQRLRLIGYVRSFFFGMLVLGLLYIWGEQVHNFAVSIFAIAFALVFSVKELCMCVNGSVFRLRGNLYNLGDRIEINGVRGEVIDMNLLSTTILESDSHGKGHHHTGRVVVFPNSFVMNHFVVNESFVDHFLFHTLTVPLHFNEDWKKAQELLLSIAKEECTPYLEMARKRVSEVARHKSIDFPSVEPRVVIQMPEPLKINLSLRFPGPAHLKGRLEQTILSRFLERFFSKTEQDTEALREPS